MIDLNSASAFLGFVFINFCASTIRAESAGAIVYRWMLCEFMKGSHSEAGEFRSQLDAAVAVS